MFRNRHVVIALLVAPLLALIAYFAVDSVVAEKPQKAVAGSSYPLVAKSNCRYASGQCSLVNGEFRVEILSKGEALEISSTHAASLVRVALTGATNDSEEYLELTAVESNLHWLAPLPAALPEQGALRMAVVVAGSTYFVETSLAFLTTE